MKTASTLVLAAASLILVGQGCAPIAPPADLPTPAPTAETMEKKDDAMMPKEDAMMDKEEGAMEPKDDAMMEKEEAMAPKDDAMMAKDDGAMMKSDAKASYVDYASVLAAEATKAGRPVVLYFYAAWCPICRAEDPKIKSWIESSELPIAGFRVNYDTEKELKAKYKIPYQHTTVFLNAKGEEVERFNGPVTEAEFDVALAKAAGK